MGKRIQRVEIDKMATKLLELGYQEENIHTEVQIDCAGVLWDYPDATVEMTVQAPSGEKYPVTPELADNNVVVWTVTDSDLVYAGSGKIQLTLKNGTEVIKSASCSTRIMESITATGPAPTPLENWMQRAEETAEQIAETAAETVLEDYGTVKEDVTGLKSAFEQLNDNVITESAGPAPIVSIADGADGMPMRSVEVSIEPVQDLHGYEYPWPAGGGKNLADTREIDVTIAGCHITSDSEGVMSISGTRDDTTGWKVIKTFQTFTPGNYVFSTNNNHITCLVNYTQKSGTFTVAEGDQIKIALYNMTAGEEINYTGIKVIIAKGDTAPEVWTPYSNVCPISGWTGAKVTRTGINLLGGLTLGQAIVDAVQSPSNTYLGSDSDGNYVTFAAGGVLSNKIVFANFKPNKQYTFILKTKKENTASANLNIQVRYSDGVVRTLAADSPAVLQTKAFVTDANKTVALLEMSYGGSRTFLYYDESGIFEGVLTADDYEPYLGQTYEVTFPADPGTVYGGTLDVVSGKLVVDRAITDLGALSWQRITISYGYYFVASISDNRKASGDIMCSAYKFVGYGAAALTQNCTISRSATNKNVFVRDDSYSTAEDFKTAVSGVQLCYYLEEPISIQLDPVVVLSLLGENHIFADAGNTSVTYPADTKMYIDRKITEAVANALNA